MDLSSFIAGDVAASLIPSRLADADRFLDLLQSLVSPVTSLDAVIAQAQTGGLLSPADSAGVWLDAIGKLIGQPRKGGAYPLGESDTDYRRKLRAAVLRNRSGGTAEDLIAVVSALLGDNAQTIHVSDCPPAAFTVSIGVAVPLTSAEQVDIVDFVEAAKAAGVKVAGIAWYTDPTFAFDGFPDPPFAGYDDGSGTVGGFFAVYFHP